MENQTVARSGFSLGKRKRNQLLAGYNFPISSLFHVNGRKNFIPVQVHTGLSSTQSHVNTPLAEFLKCPCDKKGHFLFFFRF